MANRRERMKGKNRLFLNCVVVFFLLQTSAVWASQRVELWCKASSDGKIFIDVAIKDPEIKGLIVKATIPQKRRLISSTPKVRHFKDGVLKWFIETRGRNEVKIEAHLDGAISDEELHVEAMYKVPGKTGLITVEAKTR